ncbi:hypothetical protein [Limimaricola sp. AA108-03]|uniref:hypothetical protein n=1 Tax=Limimaricola sp. AA108-03 TaxID=3425945 RepID=UPI003D774521
MRRAALLAVLAWAAEPAVAQELGLRSGEHPDRIRIVAEIPPGDDWRLGREPGGYALRLGAETARFDATTVFEKIQRDRVSSVEPVPGGLRLRLACAPCHADAFLWRDRLVIDIIDGPPPPGSRFERSIEAPAPRQPALLPVIFETAASPPPLRLSFPRVVQSEPKDHLGQGLLAQLDTTRRALLEGVARAASQGLLDASESLAPVVSDPPSLPVPTGTPVPGLSARSGFDVADGTAAPSPCPDPDHFALAEGTLPDADFAGTHRALRDAMAGDFGRVPPGAPEALARFYIRHGFGQEARAVLAIDGTGSRERVWLALLARLVDGPIGDPGPLAETQACLGPTALWGALARGSVEAMPEIARTAAIAELRLLPQALRGHLGARLARLFVAAGDPRGADEILGRSGAAPTGDTLEARYAEAEIAGALEGPEAEIEALSEIAEQDARLTPEGLSRLIDMLLEEGQEVPGGLLELARALRFEHRGQPAALILAQSETRALIATGLHEAALDLVDAMSFDPDLARELRGAAFLAMTRDLDEAAFLERVFAPPPGPLTQPAETAIAARLLDLGFAETALARLAALPGDAERDGLRRRAQMALDRAASGLVEGGEAALIAPEEAEEGAERDTKRDAARLAPDPMAAWRAGDWEGLARSGDPLFEAASIAARRPATPPEPEPAPGAAPSLSQGRALVEEARAARDLATGLMSRFTLDPEPE